MLTQGSAALWYQQWVETEHLIDPQALILFDALPQPMAQQKMLAVSLARILYPILDIYRRPNSPLAWHNQNDTNNNSAAAKEPVAPSCALMILRV